jgi:hypothetical protein
MAAIPQYNNSYISLGWHGSGNFDFTNGNMNITSTTIWLAGTSGNFKLDSGTVNGDIDNISVKGSGEIFASSSLNTTGINLGTYCVSASDKYKPNSKFTGSPTALTYPCDHVTWAR